MIRPTRIKHRLAFDKRTKTVTILFSALLFLLADVGLQAQTEKNYKPVIKSLGGAMDLENGKTLTEFRELLTASNFEEITPAELKNKNVSVMEGTIQGATMTYEISYLPDGRIYELVVSIDSDKEQKYGTEVKMTVQKIAFNGLCIKMNDELGMPTISIVDWTEPFSQEDWHDDVRTAQALISHKLLIMFGWISEKYKGTEFEHETTMYVSLDPLLRVRVSVKDIELFKLAKRS